MNPVVTVKSGGVTDVIYTLTDEDRKKLAKVQLMDGTGAETDAIMHRMCAMQAVAMLTVQADREIPPEGEVTSTIDSYTYQPICVSGAITGYIIELNDAVPSQRMRNQLRKVAEDILNTCPIRRTVSKGGAVSDRRRVTPDYTIAEKKRKAILEEVPIFRKGEDYCNDGYDERISMPKRLDAIRRAAAVFYTDERGVQHA